MKNLLPFLKQCIAEVIVEPRRVRGPHVTKRMRSFLRQCIAEVIVEPVPRRTKVYGNPRRWQATKFVKECILEVLKENLTEGFDPLSNAGPNVPQDNPYPEWNSKMAKLEEAPKEDAWTRYDRGYKQGRADKLNKKKTPPSDSVASVGYQDGIAGKDSATPETVRKTIKENEVIYKDRQGGQWVYRISNPDTGGYILIRPENVRKYLKRGYRLVAAEPWNDPRVLKDMPDKGIVGETNGRYAQTAGAGEFSPTKFAVNEYDDHQATITRVKKEVYAALKADGFQQLGDTPREYMEYYLNGFVTVQLSISYNGSARIERYYDSEMVNNIPGHNIVRTIPIPEKYDPTFVQNLIKLARGLKRRAVGDESIFGGIDDIEEGQRSQTTEIEWQCPYCKQMTSIPIEIESPSDYIAGADCEHCGKEISDPNLDQQVYQSVINHYAGRGDYLKDTRVDETIELTPTGRSDDWSRPIYTDSSGKVYVDVNLGNGTPAIHTVSGEGEPDMPVRNFQVTGQSKKQKFPNALCPRCKNSKPELMKKLPNGKMSCTYCHWEENPGEPYNPAIK